MFTNILLPTDGSKASESAIFKGIELARLHRARVTGLYVMPEFHILSYRVETVEDTRAEFQRDCQLHAQRYLDFIERTAAEARVPCSLMKETGDHPHELICSTALKCNCDLVVMASHGRRGMAGLLLGSETQRVLTHTHIPVLIMR
jgi:nucleotide-binding universal stress UspA family protein